VRGVNISPDNSRYAVFYSFRMSTLTASSLSWPEYLKKAYEPLETEDGLTKVAPLTRCEDGFNKPGNMSRTN
jgi:hypothetical protein